MSDKDQKADKPSKADHSAANGKGQPPPIGMAAMQTWLQIGAEAVRFVAVRQQENLKTLHALRSCASPAEMRDVQFQAFKTAQDQYAAQTRRMMDMAGLTAIAGMPPMPGSTPLRYDDVPV